MRGPAITRGRECARIEYHEDVESETLKHHTMAERKRKAGTASRAHRKRDPEGTREAILEADTRSAKERRQIAERFAREIIRISLHGTLRPEKYPDLDARLHKGKTGTKAKA